MRQDCLKGFSDYADYQSYAQVCVAWMSEAEHRHLYDFLLNQKEDPVSVMRRMSAEAHAKMEKEGKRSHGINL